MIFNPIVSGGGGSTAPFLEIDKNEADQYVYEEGACVLAAIYCEPALLGDPCLLLPLTTVMTFSTSEVEISTKNGFQYYRLQIGNAAVAMFNEAGPVVVIQSGGGVEIKPEGWSVRYFVYKDM